MYKFLPLILIYSSLAFAQTAMTIPDPFDPVRKLPLDSAGQVECIHSKLDGVSPEECAKAKKFYTQQFANPDLRLSIMMNHIRPHPKHLIYNFLTPTGVRCGSSLSIEKKKLCSTAKTIFKSLDKEEQQSLINELEQKLAPVMIVPLTGEMNCSWSKLSKKQYAYCQKQNSHLSKMLFEERLKHNEQAMMIIQLIHELQQQQNDCKPSN